jgi:hypothetical protein
MPTQLIESLVEMRWFIAIVSAVLSAVWIVQREKTKRQALLCAVVDNVEQLPALQRALERLAGDNSAGSQRGAWLIAVCTAYSKLPFQFHLSVCFFAFFGSIGLVSTLQMYMHERHRRELHVSWESYREQQPDARSRLSETASNTQGQGWERSSAGTP